MMYYPAEDSVFLSSFVRMFASGRVLDLGCGSGILSSVALESKRVKSVLGVDIDEESVNYCKKNISDRRARFIVSDFFSSVSGIFDTIVCNPPYLPKDDGVDDRAIYGGVLGQEFSESVVVDGGDHLSGSGVIIILTSSLSDEKKFLRTCAEHLFDIELLGSLRTGFESLSAWRLKKNDLRKKIEKKGVAGLRFFSKGKRGFVLTGMYKKVKVAVKVKNPVSLAVGRLKNETVMLRIVNKVGIGPKFLFSGDDFVVYEFVDGTFLRDVIDDIQENYYGKEKIIFFTDELLRQCKILDSIGIEKGEMSRPLKNAIVTPDEKLVLIDFERARMRENPKNTRQALQFLARLGLMTKEDVVRKGKKLKNNS